MTINFTFTDKGVTYNLGHIHQTIIDGKLRFVLLPSIPANPPFCYPKLHGAKNRMLHLYFTAIENGVKVPKITENIYNGVPTYTY